MGKLTELQKLKKVAVDHQYWTNTKLIRAALKAGLFMNLNQNKPYEYGTIYAMLRDGKEWVTKKLTRYAAENPNPTE